ncbi:MAG TPA: hypothetical protein VNJ02_16900 [Vicinamibacterales bacterium]|nr:hypothetical protein [Vicinamibacterales bacterium]
MDASDFGADRFVTLRGLAVPVPADAYRLLLNLEVRAFNVSREGDRVLVVEPHQRLTPEDLASIRRWKWHLLILIDYCNQPHLDAHLFDNRAADSRRLA